MGLVSFLAIREMSLRTTSLCHLLESGKLSNQNLYIYFYLQICSFLKKQKFKTA